jgi:hypothetical protein
MHYKLEKVRSNCNVCHFKRVIAPGHLLLTKILQRDRSVMLITVSHVYGDISETVSNPLLRQSSFLSIYHQYILHGRSQWPRGLRRRSTAKRLLGSWVRIAPGAWMFVSCWVFVLSGRGLCDGPIPRPEESYRLWRVSEYDEVKINNLDTCCEQVGRRGKDCETKNSTRST